MPTVYVSVGSNVDPEHHIRLGLSILRQHYNNLRLSPVYRTEAVGFEGDDFLNLAASFETDDTVEQVAETLDEIENQCGRIRGEARFGPRTLDLDLLLYDDLILDKPGLKLPRDEILNYAFVLRPLADLAPGLQHPVEARCYADLWTEQAAEFPELQPVDIEF